jgi:hypothetical protein
VADYFAKLTANACGGASAFVQTISITTAVSYLEFLDVFTIYPNPVNNFFLLRVEGKRSDDLMVDLIGMTGQKLMTKSLSFQSGKIEEIFSCKGFPKGMYFVQVTSTDGIAVRKILIQ